MENKTPINMRKNYIYNLMYEICILLTPIVTTPYLSRVLGADGVGRYSFSHSISTYFILLAGLGFSKYAQREVARYQDDKDKYSIVFWEVLITRFVSVSAALLLQLTLVLFGAYPNRYYTLLLIMSVNVAAVGIDIAFLFQGKEEFGKVVFRNILVKAVSIILIFVLVKTANDVWVYALILVAAGIISNLVLWAYVPKTISRTRIADLHPLRHLKPALILFIPTIAASLYGTIDKVLIGAITASDFENGNYEQAQKIVNVAVMVVTSLGTVVIPRNASRFQKGDIKGVERNIEKSCRFVCMIGFPMLIGLLSIADMVVPWFLGEGFNKAGMLMRLLSPLVLIIGFSNVFGLQYLIPSGEDKKFTIASVVGALTNAIVSVPLIFFMKSYGAAIATVFAEIAVTTLMYRYVRKAIHLIDVLHSVKSYILSSILMGVVCSFLASMFEATLINTFLVVAAGAGLYVGCLILAKDDFFVAETRGILAKLRRKES